MRVAAHCGMRRRGIGDMPCLRCEVGDEPRGLAEREVAAQAWPLETEAISVSSIGELSSSNSAVERCVQYQRRWSEWRAGRLRRYQDVGVRDDADHAACSARAARSSSWTSAIASPSSSLLRTRICATSARRSIARTARSTISPSLTCASAAQVASTEGVRAPVRGGLASAAALAVSLCLALALAANDVQCGVRAAHEMKVINDDLRPRQLRMDRLGDKPHRDRSTRPRSRAGRVRKAPADTAQRRVGCDHRARRRHGDGQGLRRRSRAYARGDARPHQATDDAAGDVRAGPATRRHRSHRRGRPASASCVPRERPPGARHRPDNAQTAGL
ncbi:MAG: hypothetical protein QOJ46_26 [bacterium]